MRIQSINQITELYPGSSSCDFAFVSVYLRAGNQYAECEKQHHSDFRRSRCVLINSNMKFTTVVVVVVHIIWCLKKNHNAPRPSEHPPVRGKVFFMLSLKPRPFVQSSFDM